jgi:hypothetical protein
MSAKSITNLYKKKPAPQYEQDQDTACLQGSA